MIDVLAALKRIKTSIESVGVHDYLESIRCFLLDKWWLEADHQVFDSANWIEEIEINKKEWLRANLNLREFVPYKRSDMTMLTDLIDRWRRHTKIRSVNPIGMNLGEIAARSYKLYGLIVDEIFRFIDDSRWEDLEEMLPSLFGMNRLKGSLLNSIIKQQISCSSKYSTPAGIINKEIAKKCCLFTFRFRGRDYVAINNLGYDLSPRLDAYQVLSGEFLPSKSLIIEDPIYSRSLLPKDTFDSVINVIKTSPIFALKGIVADRCI